MGVNSNAKTEDWRNLILRRELLRHARSLEQLAAKLEEAEDYPTQTAVTFCQLIGRTAGLVASKLDSAPNAKLPFIYVILRSMGEHLRFAERSRIEQTPWSMVQATENFLKQHTPKECCFILRPQWSYNYSIRGAFVETLRECFKSLSEWLPLTDWEQAVGEIGKSRIYCISFPRVERMNVLMHVNWGHEVGHILASDWLDQNFGNLWASVQGGIKLRIKKNFENANKNPQEELLKNYYMDRYISDTMNETRQFTECGFKELISDFVGAHLLGPAVLACLGVFSVRFRLDQNPSDCGRYPPWRMRLRKVSEVVGTDLNEKYLAVRSSECRKAVLPYVRFLQQVKELGSTESDLTEINADIRTREAYQLIEQQWSSVQREVLKFLPKESQLPYQLEKSVDIIQELVLRLKQGIPPNEIGTWPDTRPASIADIWNASWAYSRLCLEEDANWGKPNNFEDLFRLTLKAIEASYVQTTFGPELKQIAEHEHIKQSKN